MHRRAATRAQPPAYRFVIGVVRPVLRLLTRQEWRGGEHLPEVGGFVVAANHTSYVDPFTFAHFLVDHGHPPRYLAKEEVFRIPVLGQMIAAAGQIRVYRESANAGDAFRAAIDAVRDGQCVAILPEGTLTRDPGIWPMTGKTGAVRVALATGCPLIPIAQWGPEQILAPYGRWPHVFPRKVMHVWAGPAVDLADLHGKPIDDVVLRAATARVMAAITGLLEQIRGERAPTTLFDPRAEQVHRPPGRDRHPPRTPFPTSSTEGESA